MKTTKTVSISMPPADLEVAGRLANSTNRSLSDTFWQEVDAYARPKAEALGLVESDVNRLIEEYRREKRAKTNNQSGK